MKMKRQGYNDRLDERLGEIDGAERTKEQSYKARRDESRAMKKAWEEKKEGEVFHYERHHFKEEVDIANNMRTRDISFEDMIFSKRD